MPISCVRCAVAVRDDAVSSNDREHEGDRRKHAEQQRREATVQFSLREQLGHGADAGDRLITVDRPDGCLGRRDQRDRIAVGAQQDEGSRVRGLAHREVRFRPWLPLESAPLGIRHDADDRLPSCAGLRGIVECHAPAERILARKEPSDERLVDHDDWLGLRRIGAR